MLNVDWKYIHDKLGIYKTTSQSLLRKYKTKFKRQGFNLIDNQTIPTWFFVKQYSKDYGISPRELCMLLNYDFKNYLSYESFIKENENAK